MSVATNIFSGVPFRLKRLSDTRFPLEEHEVTINDREDLVEWMIKVNDVLDLENKTLFIAVDIMDKFFMEAQRNNSCIFAEVLLLVGVTCIFMACKVEEL